jgi:hypothetical protein
MYGPFSYQRPRDFVAKLNDYNLLKGEPHSMNLGIQLMSL